MLLLGASREGGAGPGCLWPTQCPQAMLEWLLPAIVGVIGLVVHDQLVVHKVEAV